MENVIDREIKVVGQLRDDRLRRMTAREVSFKHDWHYCPECHYFYLPDAVVNESHPCDKLRQMGNSVIWIDDQPYLFEHQFAEEYSNVEKVLQAAF